METFQIIVLIVAAIVLVGSLTWFGITIRKTTTAKTSAYPPTFSSCPDYWTKDGNVCVVPVSRNNPVHKLGTTEIGSSNVDKANFYSKIPGYTPGYKAGTEGKPDTIDFSDAAWKKYGRHSGNASDDCIYKEWATRVGVTWDGITNYNQCA